MTGELFTIEVSLALGADISADPGTWVWTPIPTEKVLARDGGVTIRRGRADWQTSVQPSWCEVLVDNADGRFSRLNPLGVWFGLLGKNTPLRVRACAAGGALATRFVGFVSEWPPRWTPGQTHYWVPVRADGVLRRLGQGATPLKSALRRTYTGANLLAYWPMEEEGPSFQIASGLSGGVPIRSSVELEFVGGQVGTTRALNLVSNTFHEASASVTLPTTDRFQIEFAGVSDQGVDTVVMLVRFTTENTGIQLAITAAIADGQPHHKAARFTQNGGNVDIDIYHDGVFSTTITVAATIGSTVTIQPDVGVFTTGIVTLCHLAVFSSAEMSLPASRASAAKGYAGEVSGTRFARLCTEESITDNVTAGSTEAMGAQTTKTLLDLLRECEAAEAGLTVERRTGELGFDPHAARENLTVALALDYDQGHIGIPFEPADDDRLTRNKVIVTRAGGSNATVEQTEGPMGTDPVTGAGLYDEELTLNLYTDDQPAHHAGWRVNLGTVNELRYPRVILRLASTKMAAKIATWLTCDIGSRITIDNLPANMPPDLVDQILEGYTERIDSVAWDVELNLSPYKPYGIFVVSDTSADAGAFVGRLAGDEAAAIRVAIDSDDTSIVIDPNRYRWTTVADDFDPDLTVRFGGETADVSSISTTAATFIGATAQVHADNAAVTPTIHGSAVAGDLLLIWAAIRNSGTGIPITPTGYTRLPVFAAGDNVQMLAKVHSGSEVDPLVSFSGSSAGNTTSAQMTVWRGTPTTLGDLADIVVDSAAQLNGSAQNIAYPGLYPYLQEGCIVLAVGWKQDDHTGIATLSGFIEIDDPTSTLGNDQGGVWDYQIQTTPAVVNEGSFVVSGGAAAISRSAVFALAAGFQTLTVSARSVNGTQKAHSAGTRIEVERAFVLGL